jgi:hypothetical protein
VQLLVTVLQRTHRMLNETDQVRLADDFAPYLKGHAGQYVYHLKKDEVAPRLQIIGDFMARLLTDLEAGYGKEDGYEVLARAFGDHFRYAAAKVAVKANDELSADSLQSPDDPDATYPPATRTLHPGRGTCRTTPPQEPRTPARKRQPFGKLRASSALRRRSHRALRQTALPRCASPGARQIPGNLPDDRFRRHDQYPAYSTLPVGGQIRGKAGQRRPKRARNRPGRIGGFFFRHFSGLRVAFFPAQAGFQPSLGLLKSEFLQWSRCYKNNCFSSPHMILALLKQLIAAGVKPTDIVVYDAVRYMPNAILNLCQGIEIQGVRFPDFSGGDGREACQRDPNSQIQWSVDVQGNATYLPTVVTEAAYMINMASLKGHSLAGVTLAAKNHFGTIMSDLDGESTMNAPRELTCTAS